MNPSLQARNTLCVDLSDREGGRLCGVWCDGNTGDGWHRRCGCGGGSCAAVRRYTGAVLPVRLTRPVGSVCAREKRKNGPDRSCPHTQHMGDYCRGLTAHVIHSTLSAGIRQISQATTCGISTAPPVRFTRYLYGVSDREGFVSLLCKVAWPHGLSPSQSRCADPCKIHTVYIWRILQGGVNRLPSM
jgi:hypothetical protein